MKYAGILKLMLIGIAALVLWSCEDRFTDEVDSLLNEKIEFILREDAIYLQTASIRVKHSGSEDTQWVYMQTEDLVTDADELIAERVSFTVVIPDRCESYAQRSAHCRAAGIYAHRTDCDLLQF